MKETKLSQLVDQSGLSTFFSVLRFYDSPDHTFKKVHRAKTKHSKSRASSSKTPQPMWMTSASSKTCYECSASYPGLDQALRTELELQ